MSDSPAAGVPFIHLRAHSSYSLSEGALPVKQLASLRMTSACRRWPLPTPTICSGRWNSPRRWPQKGIQPIIGCTLKVDFAGGARHQLGGRGGTAKMAHLALIAKDEEGYGNLMRLSSSAWLDNAGVAEPHVGFAELEARSGGLICLTGGPGGPVNEALVDGQMELAEERLLALQAVFGDRLYVELQRHGTEPERIAEPGLIDLAIRHALPLVASNEPYFAHTDDFAAHDALICIAEGEVLAEEDRRRLTPEHYFKSAQEMAALFADCPRRSRAPPRSPGAARSGPPRARPSCRALPDAGGRGRGAEAPGARGSGGAASRRWAWRPDTTRPNTGSGSSSSSTSSSRCSFRAIS
jgi:DNA polymerase III subunit alpha